MQKFASQDNIKKFKSWQLSSGFTGVELLIVVVVIAILAAIVLAADDGITANTRESSLKADLTNGVKQLNLKKVEEGSFPNGKPGYLASTIHYSGSGDAFCISASVDGRMFHIAHTGSIQEGPCHPFHQLQYKLLPESDVRPY